nr:hypothetical protein AP065_15215 [Listeria monocytogenes]
MGESRPWNNGGMGFKQADFGIVVDDEMTTVPGILLVEIVPPTLEKYALSQQDCMKGPSRLIVRKNI